MPASISLIRHAEKQLGDGPPHGVLVDGRPDPESLTPRGWQWAGALVGLFLRRADQPGAAILPTPTRLFASEVGPHSHSRRPVETLLPLSERLGRPLDEPFLQDELAQLVEVIRACDGNVLIAWEHKRLPLIGEVTGAIVGGPPGAIVGGIAGAALGGIAAKKTVEGAPPGDQRPAKPSTCGDE